MTGRTDAVEVSGLHKSFGSFAALRDVSFALAQGSTVALLGPSGCGKTTILRCLAGLERPDSGRIRIGAQMVFDHAGRVNLPPERRGIGVVFQSYAVWPHMTVAENVGFPLKVRRLGKATIQERVLRALDMVGLASSQGKMATQLSGGQQQRVAIARALIGEPQVVLFDEALSNLDATMREQTRFELKLLQERVGFTALYVTHDQTEAFALAGHVIVMNAGAVETEGDPKTVFDQPATPFVARFMGLNVLEGHTVVTTDDPPGMVAFQIAGGPVIRGIRAVHQAAVVGQPPIACIRKEHIQVARLDEAATAAPGVNVVEADIAASSFLGVYREYLLRVGGSEVKALSTRADLEGATRVSLSFDPAHCVVFA